MWESAVSVKLKRPTSWGELEADQWLRLLQCNG